MTRILVLEPQPIVAQDLAESIRELRPGVEVAVVHSLAAGLDRVMQGDIHVVFANARAWHDADPASVQTMKYRAQNIVVVGGEAGDAAHDHAHLDLPFTIVDIDRLLVHRGDDCKAA